MTKEDKNFVQSSGHSDLTNAGPPRTISASQARIELQQLDLEELDTDSGSGEDRREERNEEASTSKGPAKPSAK